MGWDWEERQASHGGAAVSREEGVTGMAKAKGQGCLQALRTDQGMFCTEATGFA